MAPKVRPPIERFREKVHVLDNGCHEWTAYRGNGGYGRFYVDGRGALAHRWAYEHLVGPIPDGLVIDHLCRNRACVNPEHLEPVSPSENVMRGIGPAVTSAMRRAMTHCLRGHPLDGEEVRVGPYGYRLCLQCKRLKAREHYQKNRAAYIAKAAEWRQSNPDRSREHAREGQRRYRKKMQEGASK